jgi:hypothetical protein
LFSFETPLLDTPIFFPKRGGILTIVLVFFGGKKLNPFDNYITFPDVRRFENFLFHGAAFDLEIRFQRLIC